MCWSVLGDRRVSWIDPVTKLSGGEAQRVALARAILSHPRLLLLDEPLASLDINLKEKILPYLARVRDEFEIPMIYVTHSLTEVLTLADWVLMIKQGQLITQGVPREALRSSRAILQIPEEQFENVFTVAFVGLQGGEAGRSKVRLQSGEDLFIPVPASGAQPSIASSHQLRTTLSSRRRIPKASPRATSCRGGFGTVDFLGGQAMLTVFAGEEFYVRLTAAAVSNFGLRDDSRVFLIMKTRSFHLL